MRREARGIALVLGALAVASGAAFACTVEDRVATARDENDGAAVGEAGDARAESSIACTAPAADCNASADDGCETDLRSSRSHCGACGRDCGGADCKDGRCGAAVFTSTGAVVSLVTDDRWVYWTESISSPVRAEIRRAPKLGGSPSRSFVRFPDGDLPVFTFAAVDPTFLFWGESTGTNQGFLHVMPKENEDGVGHSSLPQADVPFGVAVDDTHVYWSDTAGVVHRAAKSLGSHEIVAKGVGTGGPVALDAGAVVWIAGGLAADDGALMRATKAGHGSVAAAPVGEELAGGLRAPLRLTIAKGRAYWTSSANRDPRPNSLGAVMSVDLGTRAVVTVASGLRGPFGIAVDDEHVYWSEIDGGALRRKRLADPSAPIDGIFERFFPTGDCGGVPCDAGVGPTIAFLHGDGDWIFWTDQTLGGIWRWRKDLR